VPAPAPERAAAGASKAVQAEEPSKRATRAQVENALKNVRALKFHLDRNICSKQRAANLVQDSDAEESHARLQEMEARSAAYTEQIEKLQSQLQKPDRQTFRMLYDAELYESKA
jgi:vancomycin resistance protein YoaR